jgi:hypothetical protein
VCDDEEGERRATAARAAERECEIVTFRDSLLSPAFFGYIYIYM